MNTSYNRMVITDLDGTLLRSDQTFSPTDMATLAQLGEKQILRVIATGRSLYSAYKVIPHSFPLDYLVCSSGAGIFDWQAQQLLKAYHLAEDDTATAFKLLIQRDLDFMLHRPIPENHYFLYRTSGRNNPDFIRRCELYQDFAVPLGSKDVMYHKACQFVVIEPHTSNPSQYASLKTTLAALNVIRATSPLDGRSTWIEIFPKTVSKSLAGEWIARQHHCTQSNILTIGNDYNDLDLLQWGGTSYVVSNAPQDLKALYPVVKSHNEHGFSDAVKNWINH